MYFNMKTKDFDRMLVDVIPLNAVRSYEVIVRNSSDKPYWFKVYVENCDGKFYLSFKRFGCVLPQCAYKRLRKTMSVADVLSYVENIVIV